MKTSTHKMWLLSALAAAMLAACGGGGSSTTTPVTPPATPAAPAAPVLNPAAYDIRQLDFSWTNVADATFYRMLENPDGASGYTQIGSDITPAAVTATGFEHDISVHFQDWPNASYLLQACNSVGCTDSAPIFAMADEQAIGYLKASNPDNGDQFGWSAALSGDGSTFVAGANLEDSRTMGINTTPDDDGSANDSGAAYVFTGGAGVWNQQAYIKPSDTTAGDEFGHQVAISQDGSLMAVSAHNRNANAGAVYIFTRDGGGVWSQRTIVTPLGIAAADQFGSDVALSADGTVLAVGASGDDGTGAAYVFVQGADPTVWTEKPVIKAGNAEAGDAFGWSVALSDDGATLAVGAIGEDSSITGINSAPDNGALSSGAVYVYLDTAGTWNQQAYIKPSAVAAGDYFGRSVSLSQDGNTLAVGADGDETGGEDAGMAYVYTRAGAAWTEHSALAASNAGVDDAFGFRVSLNNAGDVLVVGAAHNTVLANTGNGEDSAATGIDGSQASNGALNSGAVYLFTYDALGDAWSQDAYVKASNTSASAEFGAALSLDDTGRMMAVGAFAEGTPGTGSLYLY